MKKKTKIKSNCFAINKEGVTFVLFLKKQCYFCNIDF